ncbi:hypothetical protein [Streptodolium elevatio]
MRVIYQGFRASTCGSGLDDDLVAVLGARPRLGEFDVAEGRGQHAWYAALLGEMSAARDFGEQMLLQAGPVRFEACLPVGVQEIGEAFSATLGVGDQFAHRRQRSGMVLFDFRQRPVLQIEIFGERFPMRRAHSPVPRERREDQRFREVVHRRFA